jgi:two-component system, sensor histidine kinase RegB
LNLLNNAADASSEEIELHGTWDHRSLLIEILDRGPGLSADILANAGKPFFTTKAPGHGFGIGLFLANATIERLGGTVQLFNRAEGGACTRISLPLSILTTKV